MTEEDGSFLHFINNRQADEGRRAEEERSSLVSNFDLNANIEINNNLEVQIIFDPTIGDILKTVEVVICVSVWGKITSWICSGNIRLKRGIICSR